MQWRINGGKMKKYDEEFYKVMEQFEKNMKNYYYYTYNLKRSEKGSIGGYIYDDGKTNEAFNVFLLGYTFGIFQYRD